MQNTEPTWPTQRDLPRYNLLTGLDIGSVLSGGGVWIEVGPGSSALPMQPLRQTPGVILRAIGPHPRTLPEGIEFTEAIVPEDEKYLQKNRAQAKLVTDVFGAVSYYKDPIEALIYESLLLQLDGAVAVVTELYRLGELAVWARTTDFFRVTMRQAIMFETFSVKGDASKEFSTYLRIRVRGEADSTLSLDAAVSQAKLKIGVPSPSKMLWTAEDHTASIQQIDYTVAGR